MTVALRPVVLNQDATREELQAAFARDGYLLLENFYSARECRQLKERMGELIDQHAAGGQSGLTDSTAWQTASQKWRQPE